VSKRKSIKAKPRRKLSLRDISCALPPQPQVQNNNPLIDPASTIDRTPRLHRELIAAAASLQACQAQSEVMLNTMMVQTGRGWMVRRCDPRVSVLDQHIPNGVVETTDYLTSQPAYTSRMVQERDAMFYGKTTANARLRQLRSRREAVAEALAATE